MKVKTLNEVKTELTRIQNMITRWQPRVDRALEDVERLEKAPLISELYRLTTLPEAQFLDKDIDTLKMIISTAQAVIKKRDKEERKRRDDPGVR